jgi:hypothetical protein
MRKIIRAVKSHGRGHVMLGGGVAVGELNTPVGGVGPRKQACMALLTETRRQVCIPKRGKGRLFVSIVRSSVGLGLHFGAYTSENLAALHNSVPIPYLAFGFWYHSARP